VASVPATKTVQTFAMSPQQRISYLQRCPLATGINYKLKHVMNYKGKRGGLKKKLRKPTGELKLFREIVIKRGAFSEKSGTPIYAITVSSMAHLIRKSHSEAARLDSDNIVILTPEEHYILDNEMWKMEGDKEWDWILKKQERLRKQYS
jgi:hypothetical protein